MNYLPGEQKAIETVIHLADEYGYGNLISHLQEAWSKLLQEKHGIPAHGADAGAGIVCVWCDVDKRTGRKAPKPKKVKE